MSDVTTTRICSECGLAYRESLLPHQCAEWTKGAQPKSQFDQVFEQLEAPDYPATCDQCGLEGTNATIDSHICNEPPAPRAGERKRVEHSPLPWRHQTEDGTLGTIVDADENVIAQTQQILNDPAHVRRQGNAAFIVECVNQHATLVEQRDCALAALKGVAIMLNTNLSSYDDEPWAQRVRTAIATIEQEGEGR